MPRIFVPYWILYLTAGLFFGLALAGGLEGSWLQVLLWTGFAFLSIWVGLTNRRRLKEWEKTHPTL